jgi:hypothetical protein
MKATLTELRRETSRILGPVIGLGFNPILTGREPEGWEACRPRRLGKSLGRLPLAACRVR